MFREARKVAECGIAVTLSVMFFASVGGIDDTRKAISAVQAYRPAHFYGQTITKPWVVTDTPSVPRVAPVEPAIAPVAEPPSAPAVAPVAPTLAPVAEPPSAPAVAPVASTVAPVGPKPPPTGCRDELKALNLCAKPPEEKTK